MKPTFCNQDDVVQIKELFEQGDLWVVRAQNMITSVYLPEWTCKAHELFVGAKCVVEIKLIPMVGG